MSDRDELLREIDKTDSDVYCEINKWVWIKLAKCAIKALIYLADRIAERKEQ